MEKDIFYSFDRYKARLNQDENHAEAIRALSPVLAAGAVTEKAQRTISIHTDWIEAIEEGLPYFFKAIAEDRQFIERKGDVVPVERAKKVTKESAEHLARHTHLLREGDGEELLPSKIYVKENQSNYAVYENRFLYTALCYLRDFVDSRYAAIRAADSKNKVSLGVNAQFDLEGRHYTYQLSLAEESRQDTGHSGQQQELLGRIEQLRLSVSQLFGTALMLEMAKEPQVTVPITVTNVLKSDTNFHAVFLLFNFLTAYEGPGYDLEENKEACTAVSQGFSEDLAELFLLEVLLTHCHSSHLGESWAEEALARHLAEQNRAAEEAVRLAAGLKQAGASQEQYIAQLEKALFQQKKAADLAKTVQQHQEALAEKLRTLAAQAEELTQQLAQSQQRCRLAETEAELRLQQERAQWNRNAQEALEGLTAQRDTLSAQLAGAEENLAAREQALEQCREERNLLGARLLAAKERLGEKEPIDYTEKAHFDLLEAEKNAFDKFFSKTWKAAKKQIIRDCIKGKK